jgi:quercetin dioxygenase-like cupin family protein
MTELSTAVPIIRAAADGERRWFYGGGVHTWKATAQETHGGFLLFEDQVERGKMTPLHLHPHSEESMYVLDGEILLHMDGEEHRVSTGGLAVAPRGVPHAFLVLSDGARLLCMHTPGCYQAQAFYLGASEPISPDAPTSGPVDFTRIHASAEQNGGIKIVGPPPFPQS